jgi:hypothetical protein
MPSNYEKITIDNIRRRGDEFDDIGQFISEQLYSDRSHFIYELLQNAEDALDRRFRANPLLEMPCSVKFVLFEDRLEFRHFGQLFNEANVIGVSDILVGTKKEDGTQIGNFGIGFKSVYAFTATPEIHSGNEHFIIERYIRPKSKELFSKIVDEETLFVFPFNHKELSKKDAFNLILNKLKDLGPRVLLFLNRINEIEWSIEYTAEKGLYLKDTTRSGKARHVNVVGQNNLKDEEETWIIFERPVSLIDSSIPVKVEVGFYLVKNSKDKAESIIKINDSKLVVYFPTEKLTQLGFLVQGPYRTTPARDNIPEDVDRNKKLIIETSLLVVESLQYLKEMNLLSVSLLETLPIRKDDFPENSMFYPIYNAVLDALRNEDLLPADDGTFVSGKNAKLARGTNLKTLLNYNQLSQLFKSEDKIKWISGEITQDRYPELFQYLTKEIKVEEIRPERIVELVEDSFLKNQNDKWFVDLYCFLWENQSLWKKSSSILRKKRIIRLEDGSNVTPFNEDGKPNAYLSSSIRTNFPTIKATLLEDEDAVKFLKELGIVEPDLFTEISDFILPKYVKDSSTIDIIENFEDIKKIRKWLNEPVSDNSSSILAKLKIISLISGIPSHSELYLEFESIPWDIFSESERKEIFKKFLKGLIYKFRLLKASNGLITEFKPPQDIYIKTPELNEYFQDNHESWFVCDDYPLELKALLQDMYINQIPIIKKVEPDESGFVKISEDRSNHRRGLNGFDPKINVDGLEHALGFPTLAKTMFIWNQIVISNYKCIRGIIEQSKRKNFENSERKEIISPNFGQLLINSSWLPDKSGIFHKPCELLLSELPEGFDTISPIAKDVAEKLGMKNDIFITLAKQTGIPTEDIELLKKHPIEFQRWKAEIELQKENTIFPNSSSVDVKRRQEKTAEQYDEAQEKESEERLRRFRTTKGSIDPVVWLRNTYTNTDGKMVCQICKNEMPFKKRDGDYYFEAVEAFSEKKYLPKELEEQYLALCPLCAAKYKEFIKNDPSSSDKFYQILKNCKETEVPLTLGSENTTIQFVEKHFLDIITILTTDK